MSVPVLDALLSTRKYRQTGPGKYMVSCPGPIHKNGDADMSLAVSTNTTKGAEIVLKCFTGDSVPDILAALHLGPEDLHDRANGNGNGYGARPDKPSAGPKVRERRYRVTDTAGRVFEHVRNEDASGRKVGGPYWKPKLRDFGSTLPDLRPYGSELVAEWPLDDPVFVVEGEKAANALRAHGLYAVATFGIDYLPTAEALEALTERLVVLWPDADTDPKKGRAHMLDMARRLGDIARSTKWIEPPADKFDGWDAADATRDEVLELLARVGPVPADARAPDIGLFVNVVEYCASVPDDVPWALEPLAYFGGVTLIAGIWKGGKSTLMAQAQRARETGESFLGHSVPIGPTVLVTEEGGIPIKHKVGDLRQLYVLDKRSAVLAGLDLDGLIAVLRAFCEAQSERSVLFLDTFAVFGDIEDENNAVEVTTAIVKLTHLAQETGAAIVLVHHTNKTGGSHGRGIRGSGAIPATVDIFAVLDYAETGGTTARTLKLEGRVIEPIELHIGFDPMTRLYSLLDDDDAHLAEITRWLTKVHADGDGLTYTNLSERWGLSRRKTYERVEHLLNIGRMRQEEGKRGNARALLHWSIPPAFSYDADRRTDRPNRNGSAGDQGADDDDE